MGVERKKGVKLNQPGFKGESEHLTKDHNGSLILGYMGYRRSGQICGILCESI